MMKFLVSTLDQDSLQQALDVIAGADVFTVTREKLSDGTRPLCYICADDTDPAVLAQAATAAQQQDAEYLDKKRTQLLQDLLRASVKSRLRRPTCEYTSQDQLNAQSWLDNPDTACPLVVQLRSISTGSTLTQAAQQIVDICSAYQAYPEQVDLVTSAAITRIQNATDLMTLKTAYHDTMIELVDLENTTRSIS